MQGDELLGGGLDIDGWNFLKHEPGRTVNDLVDKSYIHRQHVPLMVRYGRIVSDIRHIMVHQTNSAIRCQLPKHQRQEAHEIVVAALETKSTVDPPWIGKGTIRLLDSTM